MPFGRGLEKEAPSWTTAKTTIKSSVTKQIEFVWNIYANVSIGAQT